MQQIKSILIGLVETNDLVCSFIKFLGNNHMNSICESVAGYETWFGQLQSPGVGVSSQCLVQIICLDIDNANILGIE